jgi:spore coat protein H
MRAFCFQRCHPRLWVVAIVVGVWALAAARLSAAAKPDASDELFTNAAIRHVRIEISREGMDSLRQYTWQNRNKIPRTSVLATVREGPLVWTNVAVHLKGAYGSFRPVEDKPGLTLNFDKLAEGQRFHGLQKISLNNSVQNPSYVSEHIARELHNRAGVPTPRVDYATVELNGRQLGLYVLVEGWNKQFLKRHFTNGKGNF